MRCEWNKIEFRQQSRRKPTSKTIKSIRGFDTETENAHVRIVGDDNSWKEISTLQEALDFYLTEKNRFTLNFFWNLGFDVQAILNYEPDLFRQLAKGEKATWNGYEFRYLNRKCLTIRDVKNKLSWKFFDIYQFFANDAEDRDGQLAVAARKYLGMPEHEMKGNRAKLFDLYAIEDIGAYCVDDCLKTKLLADYMIGGFRKHDIPIKNAHSAGYVTQEYLMRTTSIPTLYDIPWQVSYAYFHSFRGGWFDTYKRGRMKITSYDLSSAYPSVMRSFPDLRDGIWKREFDENANFGISKVKISSDLCECQPISVKYRGVNTYPLLDKPVIAYMANSELKTYDFDYKVLDSWHFKEKSDSRKPFEKPIDTLYHIKNNSEKGSAIYLTAKLLLNSQYGKTAELTYRPTTKKYMIGRLFLPPYAAETTARTRARIYESVKAYKKNVVSILTDGVLFNKPIPLKIGKGLGAWEEKEKDQDCLVLKTGIYQFKEGRTAARGFGKLNNLFNLCQTKDEKLKVTLTRVETFRKCIIEGRLQDVGKFVTETKEISFNNEKKRIWEPIANPSMLLDDYQDSYPIPTSRLF